MKEAAIGWAGYCILKITTRLVLCLLPSLFNCKILKLFLKNNFFILTLNFFLLEFVIFNWSEKKNTDELSALHISSIINHWSSPLFWLGLYGKLVNYTLTETEAYMAHAGPCWGYRYNPNPVMQKKPLSNWLLISTKQKTIWLLIAYNGILLSNTTIETLHSYMHSSLLIIWVCLI